MLKAIWQRLRSAAVRAGAWSATNVQGLIFTGALVLMAVGFWMAWAPLGAIVPGSLVVGLMVAYRWKATFSRKDDE